MRKKQVKYIIFLVISLIIAMDLLIPAKTYGVDQRIESDVNQIDVEKYPWLKPKIEEIKNLHPNWNFKFFYTGLDWQEVLKQESKHGRNIIGAGLRGYGGDWICPECGTKKTYSGGKWYDSSTASIAYMMDPRNSFTFESIFQFLELSYDENLSYDSEIIKKILQNSFLDDGNLENYTNTIMEESKNKNVNPYFIAVKIIQEQGYKGGSTFKMASGSGTSENFQIDEQNKIIKVIPQTTVKNIREYLNNFESKVTNANLEEMQEEELVATGNVVNETYTIVVLGDVNRDGQVRATDYMEIKNFIMEDSQLDDIQKIAADVNLDGQVRATDYMTIKNYIMEDGDIKFEKTEYYYNIFNINATGSTVADIIRNALSWAKSKDWNTVEKSLAGGIEFISKGYISAGQNTLYFEKFDVIGDSLYWHQYAQDVLYAENQGTKLKNILKKIDATEYAYTFVIPLYENMPLEASVRPQG